MNEPSGGKTEALPKLGFLGMGRMGGPMARGLLNAGYPLVAYDPRAESLEACVSAGASPAGSAAEVVQRGQVVLTSLRSSAVFVQVAEGDILPNLRPGQIFVDLGTTEPGSTRRLASEIAAKGATLLDAPVSGGPTGAASGTLRIFVGGDRSALERCRHILDVLGDPQRVVSCGPSGTGQVVKGVNQLAMGLVDAAYLEAVAYGVRGGADPAAILQGVGGDDGFRRHLARITRLVMDGKGDEVLVKFPELPYFLVAAREQGFDMPMTAALFEYLDSGPRDWVDNMNRPRVALWHSLMTLRSQR